MTDYKFTQDCVPLGAGGVSMVGVVGSFMV